MKKAFLILLAVTAISFYCAGITMAQCSICSRTAQQMGEKPALGLNNGILYLMAAPFVLVGFIGYKWWRNNGSQQS